MDLIFAEQPYLANVYPGKTRDIGIIFEIWRRSDRVFSSGSLPIFRETYILGRGIETKQENAVEVEAGECRARKKEGADERISYHRCMAVGDMSGSCGKNQAHDSAGIRLHRSSRFRRLQSKEYERRTKNAGARRSTGSAGK